MDGCLEWKNVNGELHHENDVKTKKDIDEAVVAQ